MRAIFLFLFALLPFISTGQASAVTKSAGLIVQLPWINNFHYYDYEEKGGAFKSGFVGMGIGNFFNWNQNKVSFNTGFTGDLPVPVGPIDYAKEGTRTNIRSSYGELIYHKRVLEKMNIIAGINYIRYRFTFTSYVDSLPWYYKVDNTLGVTIGSEYIFSKLFTLSLLYRPAVRSFDKKGYRHVLSLDGRCDITLWKKRS